VVSEMMNELVVFTEKLSELFFLEIKKEVIENYFNYTISDNIDFPIRAKRLIKEASDENYGGGFSISYIIEGMAFLLGADPKFKYNNLYKEILKSSAQNSIILKKIIADEVKDELIEDAYILLKGLTTFEQSGENYEKALLVVHDLAQKDKKYIDEEKDIIEKAKIISHFPLVYLYEAMLFRTEDKLELAIYSMDRYVENGGDITENISSFMEELNVEKEYKLGKELSTSEPLEAIKLLLPLIDKLEKNASLYFHIAVAYRNLKSFEKAIYYLNEAMTLDSNIIELYNEFGLNYASINDYDSAILYFRKAFEATKSIEVCTNLVLCYYNNGNMEQAKLHLEIAKKIMPSDEILAQLEKMLNGI
jgi:tetratricopeptide (TPR) repeat protein